MIKKEHVIMVSSRKKEMTNYLLKTYNIDHKSISKISNNPIGLGLELIKRNINFLYLCKKFKPDLLTGIMGPTIAPIGKIINKPSIVFYDTETANITNSFVYPLSTKLVTPKPYRHDLGEKHIKYDGYQELAYLHPKYFKADPLVLKDIGVEEDEDFFIIRLVSWNASHDIGKKGLNEKKIDKLISLLSKHGRVFISSERKKISNKYKLDIPAEKIHDLLYFSKMYIGEGGTMASEAAILGTPSIFYSPFSNCFGNFIELEKKYDMMYSINDFESLQNKINYLLNSDFNLKKIWFNKRKKLISEKIDVNKFMIDLVEEYE
jgi:uncharacterized protein